jgi:hypothetical protein
VALQSLKDLGRLTYRRFLELFRHMVGLLGRVISPSQSLYLHRTTQHRKTRTNIHALSGIRTHDPSNQPAKTHASDRTATVTGNLVEWGTALHLHYLNINPFYTTMLITNEEYNPEDSHLRTHRRENLKSYLRNQVLSRISHCVKDNVNTDRRKCV